MFKREVMVVSSYIWMSETILANKNNMCN